MPQNKSDSQKKTHFGFQEIDADQKEGAVRAVFDSVATSYDVMNDLMSLGVHRLWKQVALRQLSLQSHHQVLDLACGTGDMARLIEGKLTTGRVFMTDINDQMLSVGRDRLIDEGHWKRFSYVQANGEYLPYRSNSMDRVIIAFGLRNITNKGQAIAEMKRVLKPGGLALVLEFSQCVVPVLSQIYDAYSFKLLPFLGQVVANDRDSYQYLVESIRKHPKQEDLAQLILDSGFDECKYQNLTGGIVAIHRAWVY